MSGYVSIDSYAKSAATVSNNNNMLMNSNSSTSSQKNETKIINGGVISGMLLAALFAFMNVGASTTPSHSSLNSLRVVATPEAIRNNTDENEEDNENLSHESDFLQELFGMNTAQWARLLKVERKTVYNWRNSSTSKVKLSAARRISVLNKFSKEFNQAHKEFFSKFLFGRKADPELLKVFLKEPLDLDEMLIQYDNIYTKLDGLVKRKSLLGD